MGSALLFIVRSRLLVYSAGSGVNRVQVVSKCLHLVGGCFVLSRQKLYVGIVVCISWLHSYLCVCGCAILLLHHKDHIHPSGSGNLISV